MFTIITALVEEHDQFRAWFAQTERALPLLASLEEVRRLARQAEAFLRRHAAVEEDLVLMVLDHLPAHKRRSDRFYTEHQEIDGRLTRVLQAESLDQARDWFQAAINASRRHFDEEERLLFPMIERVTGLETLAKLGLIWTNRRQSTAKV
jgi:hemerythrin-like domain-containing protein